jgi:dihydroxyacetone kinase
MLEAAVQAVKAAGGANKGDKTLLDVLIPVTQGVRSQIEAGDPAGIGARIVAAAAHGLHGTSHLEAKKGLAAALGPASVNRIDPGACSCALLFGAAVGALERSQQAA